MARTGHKRKPEVHVCSEKQRRVRTQEPDKHVHRKKDLIHG